MKVLVEKTFRFVDMLWASYIAKNSSNLQYVIVEFLFVCIVLTIRPLVEDDDEEDETELIRDGTLVTESDEEEEWLEDEGRD